MAKTWKTLLIYKIVDREMERYAQTYLRGRLIDIGCGTKPYKKMLAPYVSEHVGLDRKNPFNKHAEVDLVGTAYQIPSGEASFDCAISTAALEHLSDPDLALQETFRVLKSGGVAIYTVPFIWHLHSEPWDYFRFSKYGLRHVFEKAGFEILEIAPMAGFWVTASTMFCYYMERFIWGPLKLIPLIPVIGVCLQGAAYVLWKLDKAEQWTWMYTVVARKPDRKKP